MAALAVILVVGVVGYLVLGLTPLDAVYQTVTTVTTVGFEEVVPFGTSERAFTIVLIVVGVGVALYALTAVLGLAIEGYLGNAWGRRRMDREIARLEHHAIVCGRGRVGRSAAEQLAPAGQGVAVMDADAQRLSDCPHPFIVGDAAQDDVLLPTSCRRCFRADVRRCDAARRASVRLWCRGPVDAGFSASQSCTP
jgi:voltage-gated potassium channel